MIELIEKRQENSKTFKLGSRKNRLVVSIGAVHYKDDYASDEQWKDIDLNWVGNRITKAPYELTLQGKKITLRNKKTGEVSTIELDSIGGVAVGTPMWQFSKGLARIPDIALDTDLEIVPEFSSVKFVHILKSANAPLTAKFKVTGDFVVHASDEDGEIPVESTLVDGILTETLKPDRAIKYPVRLDPTWQVGASTDDAHTYSVSASGILLTDAGLRCGRFGAPTYVYDSGMRFLGVTIPNGATIDDGTYLIFRAYSTKPAVVINTNILGELSATPATFSTFADFHGRSRSTPVPWDNIPAWTVDEDYNSPEIKAVIQELVDAYDYSGGRDLVIFWEDDGSDEDGEHIRMPYSYNGSTEFCPQLVITIEVAAIVEGTAAGSGIGLASSSAKLDVLASALGNGIGLSLASPYLIIPAQALGSGVGQATAQAILDVLADADGSGIGLGSTEALIKVLAAAAASGEGLGAAVALLEVIAEAAGEGIGGGLIITWVEGFASGSGIGTGIVISILEGIGAGSGIGTGRTIRVIRIIPRIRRRVIGYTLGRVKPIPYNLGEMQKEYTLGRKRR